MSKNLDLIINEEINYKLISLVILGIATSSVMIIINLRNLRNNPVTEGFFRKRVMLLGKVLEKALSTVYNRIVHYSKYSSYDNLTYYILVHFITLL